ncbi:hypothetical protein JTE90_026154 [Oedothorax gibbosus]|uniref:Uncharacterized protein n=1 Tax=Oedothorax gibbosus TaxID=931172 RepID=A0AAV6V1I5_9ARAC|nr:hypothetical protein JTE90_026154 [Oedothorax gibbosus]
MTAGIGTLASQINLHSRCPIPMRQGRPSNESGSISSHHRNRHRPIRRKLIHLNSAPTHAPFLMSSTKPAGLETSLLQHLGPERQTSLSQSWQQHHVLTYSTATLNPRYRPYAKFKRGVNRSLSSDGFLMEMRPVLRCASHSPRWVCYGPWSVDTCPCPSLKQTPRKPKVLLFLHGN